MNWAYSKYSNDTGKSLVGRIFFLLENPYWINVTCIFFTEPLFFSILWFFPFAHIFKISIIYIRTKISLYITYWKKHSVSHLLESNIEYIKYEGAGTIEFLVDKNRNFYLYSLGRASSLLAKNLGFKNIIECNGDSARMLQVFINNNKSSSYKKKGALIYLGANNISYNLPAKLADLGYVVQRYKVYKTINVKKLSKIS